MSFWQNILGGIFGRQREQTLEQLILTGQAPLFSNFGTDIYLSDFINNCIDRIASEMAKIDMRSVVERNETIKQQNDDITRLFQARPNPLQTSGDFLRNVEWLRRKRGNVFIYPQYELVKTVANEFKRYTAFYPLNPVQYELGTDASGRKWLVGLRFGDGSKWVFPYEELLHLKWRRGVNTIIGGGDDNGNINERDALRTVRALDKTIQGIPKSLEAALGINGIYNSKSLIEGKKLDEVRDEFEKHIIKSSSGIMAISLTGEFTPINKQVANIPNNILEFLKSVLQERYGVSAAILSGDYNGDQNAAFYQTAIEDFLIELEQEFTSKLFSQRERDFGHKVKGYYKKVAYLNTKDKLELSNMATNTGLMTLNEIAEMFGMPPFEGGDRRIMSLNFVDTEIANAYQLTKARADRKENFDDGK
jgi:HK97 family phage portal protein